MTVYNKLWQTMKEKNISQYKLIKESGQIDGLRKNANVSTNTLNELCKILCCRLEDIAEYDEDESAKKGW